MNLKTLTSKNFRLWVLVGLGLVFPGAVNIRAAGFQILEAVPSRVFTPNGDGVNDLFRLAYDNPADAVISLAKMYDLAGVEMGDLQAGPAGFLVWDGRDRDGKSARSGVYVYRVEAENRVFSGAVVLAR